MVRVLTVNGVTDLESAALGHVLQIVYTNKVVVRCRVCYSYRIAINVRKILLKIDFLYKIVISFVVTGRRLFQII